MKTKIIKDTPNFNFDPELMAIVKCDEVLVLTTGKGINIGRFSGMVIFVEENRATLHPVGTFRKDWVIEAFEEVTYPITIEFNK